MKKIFILLAVLIFNACDPAPTPIAITVDKTTFTQSNSSASNETLVSTITNTTSTDGTISWNFSEVTAVTGWSYSISINNTVQSGTSGSFDLGANATATITVVINANQVAGTGQATIVLKDQGNDVTLNTLTYNHTATATAPTPKFSISKTSDSGFNLATDGIDPEYKTLIKNLTGNTLSIKWHRIEDASFPQSWNSATCDNVQCHDPAVTDYTCTLPPNDSFDLKTVFYLNSMRGSGTITTHIYIPADSSASVKTFVASHTAN